MRTKAIVDVAHDMPHSQMSTLSEQPGRITLHVELYNHLFKYITSTIMKN